MNLRALVAALALSVGASTVLPGTAEAGHRHDRHCRHRYSDDYRYERHERRHHHDRYCRHSRRHAPAYYSYGYHDPYPDYYYRRSYAPPPHVVWHFHGSRRCSRSHGGLFLRW